MGWSVDVLVWSADAAHVGNLLAETEKFGGQEWKLLDSFLLYSRVRKLDGSAFLEWLRDQNVPEGGWPIDATVVMMGDDLGVSMPQVYLIRDRQVSHWAVSGAP